MVKYIFCCHLGYLFFFSAHPIKDEVMPLSEMGSIFVSLRNQGSTGKLLGELLAKLSQEKGSKWVADKWDQSRLALNDIIDPARENIDKIAKEYVRFSIETSFIIFL